MSENIDMMEKFTAVFWTPRDIKKMKPDWSDVECFEFLDSIESYLEQDMISRGWDTIGQMLRMHGTEEVSDGE